MDLASQYSQGASVLIVDDEADIRHIFSAKLSDNDFQVDQASNIDDALSLVSDKNYDVILLDLFLGETNSLDAMCEFFSVSPRTKIIILTGHGSIDFAVNAMNKGATGFLVKTDRLDVNLQKFKSLLAKHEMSSGDALSDLRSLGIIGNSDAVAEVASKLKKLKDVDSTVLLQGESGTGKELFARAIHKLSNRSSGPFIAINCAAISESLLESELFGYKRGAFTDAKHDRKGYFETCSNGTLFLDEIGETSPGLQAKLLRVLQEKEVTPLGSCSPVAVNTRIVTATNRNLSEEVKNRKFREDLYYRIAVFNIMLPPLRKRKDDIPELIRHFIQQFNEKFGKNTLPPQEGVKARLMAYDWPGNIRELQNSIERAVVLSEEGHINVEDLLPRSEWKTEESEEGSTYLKDFPLDFQAAKESFEGFYIKNLLASVRGNVTEAAKVSGQYRPNVYRLIRKYQIDTKKFKARPL